MLNKNELIRLESIRIFGFGPEAMKLTKVCRCCKKTSDSDRKYCEQCGAILPRETLYDLYKSFHLYCHACDTVVANDAKYCPKCGRSLYKKTVLKEVEAG